VRRSLEKPGALLRRTVEIRIFGYAGLGCSLNERCGKRIDVDHVGNRQRAVGTMEIVGTALLIFGLPEIRQDVVKAPPQIAALAPAIVILVLATNIQQAVDRARSAQNFAAGLEHRPPA